MRHLLLAALLVAMTGCEPDTKSEEQPATPTMTPNGSDEPSAKAGVPAVNSIGMRFVPIPAGTFTMGEGDDAHEVTLTKPFKMGVHEVTQSQYKQVMGINPSFFKVADNPVEDLAFDNAVEFCRKLSELPAEKAAGNVYRLPTEAEWEYACRAGTKAAYSFGDDESDLGDYAWYEDNSGGQREGPKYHPVGSKLPNPWGLHDMHGNVWEWCQGWYDDYPSSAVTDPTGPSSGSSRVYRGGGWESTAADCRSGVRDGFPRRSKPGVSPPRIKVDGIYGVGFRVALSPSGK